MAPCLAAGLRFAYVKATEGGDWTDPRFEKNWREARRAGLRVGAYHFFSFCRPAAARPSSNSKAALRSRSLVILWNAAAEVTRRTLPPPLAGATDQNLSASPRNSAPVIISSITLTTWLFSTSMRASRTSSFPRTSRIAW